MEFSFFYNFSNFIQFNDMLYEMNNKKLPFCIIRENVSRKVFKYLIFFGLYYIEILILIIHHFMLPNFNQFLPPDTR